MISVIIPTFNRLENLRLALAALERQTYKFFEVIVADDGSTDGTDRWLRDKTHIGEWPTNSIQFKYLNCGANRGFQAGRARNFGAGNADPDSSLFYFIDSDNMMPPETLGKVADTHEKHPNCIIVGLYHFLQRMDFGLDNLNNDPDFWLKIGSMKYPPLPMPPDSSLKGRADPRLGDFPDEASPEVYDTSPVGLAAGLGCFSGNIGYPKHVFWDVGGFWEELIGHGGEDAALALAAIEKGHCFVRVKSLVGFHVWHERYAPNRRVELEKEANIDKIDRRFKLGKYSEMSKHAAIDCADWTNPAHYHKERGAQLVIDSSDTYWVVTGEHRLGITSPEALEFIGFSLHDGRHMEEDGDLDDIVIEGVI